MKYYLGLCDDSTEQDCHELAPFMKEVDKDEVMASSGHDPLTSLIKSRESSDICFSIFWEKNLIGMCGVGYVNSYTGSPWMLGSDAFDEFKNKHKKHFYKACKKWVLDMNSMYPLLCNYVDKRNDTSIQWLRHLGFSFTRLIDNYGYEGKPFWEFIRM